MENNKSAKSDGRTAIRQRCLDESSWLGEIGKARPGAALTTPASGIGALVLSNWSRSWSFNAVPGGVPLNIGT